MSTVSPRRLDAPAPRVAPEADGQTDDAALRLPPDGGDGAEAVTRERLDLDALAADWLVALMAAESALRAAGPSLAGGSGTRAARLSEERASTVAILRAVALQERSHSVLLDWLGLPQVTKRMLGLPEEVRACVFDLDGVLTTSADVHAAVWAETFDPFLLEWAERGLRAFVPFDPRHDYEALIAGRPRLDGVRAFLASRGISLPEGRLTDASGEWTVRGLANRKNERLQRHLELEGVTAFTGSRQYLQAARVLGLGRAVVSASANTTAILQRAGLEGLLDAQVDGNTIAAEHLEPKPAPDTLVAACRRLQVRPDEAAAFETIPAGVAAARAAGFRLIVAVDRNGNTTALHASVADRVITDLTELFRRSNA